MSDISQCGVIALPKHDSERRGNLSVVANGTSFPFDVRRVFYLYDVPAGEERGGHAHRSLHQFIIAVSGSFSVTIDDGTDKQTFMLNRPYEGLHVSPGIWCALNNFSSGAVALVLTSEPFSEEDYIRDYKDFIIFAQQQDK